jgi:hypothetical protein
MERLLRRSNLLLLIVITFLASCRSFDSVSPTPSDQTQDKPGSGIEETPILETTTPVPEYVSQLRNAEYQLGFVDALRVVRLADGKFEEGVPGDEDFVSIIMTDFTARGDLDNDGADEFVALVAENYGGSGVFVFLAVFTEVNGQLVYQTSAWVDDRPQVNELSIGEDGIFLDATIHSPDEPMCCPTLHTRRHYQLYHGQLDMTDYVTFTPDDRPRTITIETPASGTEVFNSVNIKGNVAIAPFENNLVYRIFDVGGVELAIGSITVSAPDLGAPATFDETILLGNILSGAVIRIEVQDVSAEDGSLFAMDSIELVVK